MGSPEDSSGSEIMLFSLPGHIYWTGAGTVTYDYGPMALGLRAAELPLDCELLRPFALVATRVFD